MAAALLAGSLGRLVPAQQSSELQQAEADRLAFQRADVTVGETTAILGRCAARVHAIAARTDDTLDPDSARIFVLAVGTLCEGHDDDAATHLPRAWGLLLLRPGLGDLTAWIAVLHADAFAASGDVDAAVTFAEAAFRRCRQLPATQRNRGAEVVLARNLIERAASLWRFQIAQETQERLAGWAEKLRGSDPTWADIFAAHAAGGAARIALQRGQPEIARPHLNAERVLARQLDDPFLFGTNALNRIRMCFATDDFAGAMRQIDELLPDPRLTAAECSALRVSAGIAAHMLGQHDRAEELLSDALAALALDSFGPATQTLAAIALQRDDMASFGAILDGIDRIATPKERLAIELRGAIAGLRIQGLRRGHSDAGERPALLAELRDCLRQLFARLQAQPPSFAGTGFLHFEDIHQILADLIDGMLPDGQVDEARRAAALAEALTEVLRVQAQGSLARHRVARTPEVDAVATALGDRGCALVHVPSRYGSHMFLLAKDGLRHWRLPPRDEVERTARTFVGHVQGSANDDTLQRSGRRLQQLLLPADLLAALLTHTGVLVSGFDTVANVALETLPLPDGSLLGERLAVANSSLVLGTELSTQPFDKPKSLAFVAELSPAQTVLDQLETTAAELTPDHVAPLVAPFATHRVFARAQRTVTSLSAAALRDDIVSILGHGVACPDATGRGIALAPGHEGDDGILRAEAVLGWQVPGLVVLTACEAGQAPRRIGEDHPANLGGAFLFAGARGVVLSRAPLQTEATLGFLAELHRRLAAGERPAAALQGTRIARRAADLRTRLQNCQIQFLGGL